MGLWQRWVSRDGIDAGLSPGRGVWLQHRGGARLWLRAGTRQSGFTHSMMFFLSSCSPCQPPKQSGQPTAPIHVCLAISSKYTWQSLCTLPATTAGTEVLAWQQCTQYSAHCPSSHAKGLAFPERRHFENSLGAAGFTRLRSRATSARPRRRRNGLPVHRLEVLNNLSTKKNSHGGVAIFPRAAYPPAHGVGLPEQAVETPIRKVSDGEGIPRCALHRSRHEGSSVG